ncbi:MAG: hypothetical protein NT138_10510 [Planctomycetales bacterium]|nr:hypothetical protein [Planctomycetales bacterium]
MAGKDDIQKQGHPCLREAIAIRSGSLLPIDNWRSQYLAGGVLISSFTTEPERMAFVEAVASGSAVNTYAQSMTQSTNRRHQT